MHTEKERKERERNAINMYFFYTKKNSFNVHCQLQSGEICLSFLHETFTSLSFGKYQQKKTPANFGREKKSFYWPRKGGYDNKIK